MEIQLNFESFCLKFLQLFSFEPFYNSSKVDFFLTDFYFKINFRGLRVCTPSAQKKVNYILD